MTSPMLAPLAMMSRVRFMGSGAMPCAKPPQLHLRIRRRRACCASAMRCRAEKRLRWSAIAERHLRPMRRACML